MQWPFRPSLGSQHPEAAKQKRRSIRRSEAAAKEEPEHVRVAPKLGLEPPADVHEHPRGALLVLAIAVVIIVLLGDALTRTGTR